MTLNWCVIGATNKNAAQIGTILQRFRLRKSSIHAWVFTSHLTIAILGESFRIVPTCNILVLSYLKSKSNITNVTSESSRSIFCNLWCRTLWLTCNDLGWSRFFQFRKRTWWYCFYWGCWILTGNLTCNRWTGNWFRIRRNSINRFYQSGWVYRCRTHGFSKFYC